MTTPNVSEQLRAFQRQIDLSCTQNQWARVDTVLAGIPIRIKSPNADLIQAFLRPFARFSEAPIIPQQTIHLLSWRWFREHAETPAWQWQFDTYADSGGHISFDRRFGAMTAFDSINGNYLIAVEDLEEFAWLRPEQSRPLIEKLMSPHGLVSLHGGTIGNGDSGVFLSARGGSGKSSLVAAAIRRGLNTTGDDFLLLDRVGDSWTAKIWALYRWIKLAPSSPAWLDSHDDFDEISHARNGEKAIVSLERCHPGAFTPYQTPLAVVVPRLSVHARLRSISPLEALAAVLPSSVAMSSRKVEATIRIKTFVESMPCYSLEVSPNLDESLDLLEPLLR